MQLPLSQHDSDMLPDLATMSAEDRAAYYETAFTRDVPITMIAVPEACNVFPELAEEIVAAYVEHTTFIFKIWVNHDAAANRFYTDNNWARDCGKLVFSPKTKRYLRKVETHKVLYRNIRFEIGTPFRALAHFTLEVRPCKLPNILPCVDVLLDDLTHEHPRLMAYLRHEVVDDIRDADPTNGKEGMNFKDLEELANMFFVVRPSWGPRGVWMSRHENEGYIAGMHSDAGCIRR